MVKDEDVCLHCGLCAERCPTGAWDMQKFLLSPPRPGPACRRQPNPSAWEPRACTKNRIEAVNDFVIKFANVNGSGSASANELFAKAVMRMGVPVSPRNIFPSNIQGMPTWYEVRVCEKGWLGRRGGVDMMVAMNPQTWDAGRGRGRARRLPVLRQHPAAAARQPSATTSTVIGMPLTADLQRHLHRPAPAHAVQEHHLRGRAVGAAQRRRRGLREALRRAVQGQGTAAGQQRAALHLGRDFVKDHLGRTPGHRVHSSDKVGDQIFTDGNSAAALGCVYGGATVCAWYPITPSSSVAEAFQKYCDKYRIDPEPPATHRYAIVQAEDETRLHRHGHRRGWNGARAFTATSGPGISLMTEFIGLAYFAEIPVTIINVQRGGPFHRHAHAHPAGRPDQLRLRVARRHQARAAAAAGPARVLRAAPPRSTWPTGCRRRSS
jgi:2-oxoglutarate ferredoxin oxidoreductase subunit alpha